MPATTEAVVYIHGVSLDDQQSHREMYGKLHNAIRARRPEFPSEFCGVEWGWCDSAVGHGHQLLAKAERQLGSRALGAVRSATDLTINPLRLAVDKFRPLMIFGFSDMFYYVSADGKRALRCAAAAAVTKHLQPLLTGGDANISLTLIGHSAGSIVAFDLLFYLFYQPRDVRDFIVPKGAGDGSGLDADADETMNSLKQLKAMAQSGQLRVRRLFTFGSPITPLAFRSNSILEVLSRPDTEATPNRLSPADYGFTADWDDSRLTGPRWVNFWDKDDPIAWPVEPLMLEAGNAVADVCINVSYKVSAAHCAYWESGKMHDEIARRW